MNKLRAIWQIIIADKIAVFTWREAAPDPIWLTAPTFSWVFSNNWEVVDLGYIKRKVDDIIKIIKFKNENEKEW